MGVVAAVEGEPTLDASQETQLALGGYRDAMTYVLQLARSGEPKVDEGLVKSLHFMMLGYDLTKNPGQWRPGDIYVRNDDSGKIVYQGPPSDDVPELVAEMLTVLAQDRSPVPVRAAMAHLNLVLIHPFSDGNGHMARCLQTLVLACDRVDLQAMADRGLLEPVRERRNRYYLAGSKPLELQHQVRAERTSEANDDPFQVVQERRQLSLT